MTDFSRRYQNYVATFEAYLRKNLDTVHTKPAILGESIKYSLTAGGKRIRPVLALACADVLNVPHKDILPFALAIEMIHTYSLIHDDLPAMDNDDYRRGQPTSHVKFGEANAILAGDALLNQAYSICFNECCKGERQVFASQYISECAGMQGMIAGQSADLFFQNNKESATEEDLEYIYECKTGKLLLAPIMTACILSQDKRSFAFERFGKQLGMLFQMTDDILDVIGEFEKMGKTLGKDAKNDKLTCVKLFGLENAKMRAEICAKQCHTLLDGIDGEVAFLSKLINYVLERCR